MVGPRMLMKMKHCRDIRLKCVKSSANVVSKRRKEEGGVGISGYLSYSKVKVKVEGNTELCRVCLQEGKIPIFGNDSAENIADSVNTFGGIEVRIEDPYPKNICKACRALLEGALLFRKTAQQSDELLKQSYISENIEDKHFSGVNDNEYLNETGETFKKKNKPIKVSHSAVFEDSNDFTSDHFNASLHNTVEEQEDQVSKNKINNKECKNNYECKKCNINFKSFQEYSDHRLSDEHENKKEPCAICNKLYPPHYMKNHMARHKQEASFICDVCGRNFVLQTSLKRHRLTHFYSLPVKCSLCPYRGRFSESLRMHMRSHTGERPYQCSECPARFVSKSNLSKHINTHKKQYDFSCEVCGRGFHTKRELEQHIKVVHRGIMDYACRICNKAFGYRKHMMRHELKVHNREKLRSGKMPLYLQVESMKDHT